VDVATGVARVPAVRARQHPPARFSIGTHFSASEIALPSRPRSPANRVWTSRWANPCQSPLCVIADLPPQEQAWAPRRVADGPGDCLDAEEANENGAAFYVDAASNHARPSATTRGGEGWQCNAVQESMDHSDLIRNQRSRHHPPSRLTNSLSSYENPYPIPIFSIITRKSI
jgi:hypothetical protein